MTLLHRILGLRPATHGDALAAGHRGVWIYHRPGCPFCLRLALVLGPRGRRTRWIDIWGDPDAAAYLRSVNAGNETVPTVVVDGAPRTNPSPLLVGAVITDRGRWA